MADLLERLSDALGGHDATPEQRRQVQDAYLALPEGGGWDDLPPAVRATVRAIEKTPPTSWDDPADVPADVKYGE